MTDEQPTACASTYNGRPCGRTGPHETHGPDGLGWSTDHADAHMPPARGKDPAHITRYCPRCDSTRMLARAEAGVPTSVYDCGACGGAFAYAEVLAGHRARAKARL